MDAVDYLRSYRIMCNNHPDCVDCPVHNISDKCDAISISSTLSPEEVVAIVERWSKDNLGSMRDR